MLKIEQGYRTASTACGIADAQAGFRARERDFPDERRMLHVGCAGEVMKVSRSAPNAPKEGYVPAWEIALPLGGAFLWEVGRSTSMIDPNCLLFQSPGQVFSETHPIKDRGHAAVTIAPEAGVLDEICEGRRPERNGYFPAVTRMASPRAQMLARQLC